MNETIQRLKDLGFQHKEFPDGWFWFVEPQEDSERLALSQAMGFGEDCAEDVPETVILQFGEEKAEWQYVYGANYGRLAATDAFDIIDELEAQGIVFNAP